MLPNIENICKDYITRTVIYIIQKYNLSDNFIFINYDTYNEEFKKII